MQIDKKLLKTYFINFLVFALLLNVTTYFYDKNYLKNNLSFLDGFVIFTAVTFLYYFLSVRNSKNKLLTAGFVMYELIYALVLKLLLLIFLFVMTFKFFDLNSKIVIITFSYMVILRLIIYFKVGIKGNSFP